MYKRMYLSQVAIFDKTYKFTVRYVKGHYGYDKMCYFK